jgi:poly [ADP-ribose] polymerase
MRTRRQAEADKAEPPVVKKQKTDSTQDAPSAKPAKVPKPPKAPRAPKNPKASSNISQPAPANPASATPTVPDPLATAQGTSDNTEVKLVKQIRKGRAAVDAECPRANDCHVYEELGKIWTETLNQTDLKSNANKYYLIQLLQNDTNSTLFYLWNR